MARINNDFDVSLTVRGVEGLAANFQATNARVQRNVRDVNGRSAARLHARTVDLCPKDTFFMSEHVRTDFSAGGLTFETGWDASDFIGTTDEDGNERSFYPPYVEFGTMHQRAQPSLTLAYIEEEPRYKQELSEALRSAIE